MSILAGAIGLIPNRIECYPMQDTSGSTIIGVKSGLNLTAVAATLAAAGILPNDGSDVSISFNGTTAHLKTDLPAAFKVASPTIVSWHQVDATEPDNNNTIWDCAVRGGGGGGDVRGLILRYQNGNPGPGRYVIFKGTGAGSYVALIGASSFAMGNPYLVIARHGTSGGYLGIRLLDAAAPAWYELTDADTTAINWIDKTAAGTYPNPAQFYVGGSKTWNVAGSGDTVPDIVLLKHLHNRLLIIDGTITTAIRDLLFENSVFQTFTTPAAPINHELGTNLLLAWNAISGATGYDVGYADVTLEDTTTITPTVVSTNQAGLTYNLSTTALTANKKYRFYVKANGTSVWRVSHQVTMVVSAPTITYPTAGVSATNDITTSWTHPDTSTHLFDIEQKKDSLSGYVSVATDVPGSAYVVPRPAGVVTSNTAKIRIRAKLTAAPTNISDWTESPNFIWSPTVALTPLELAFIALGLRWYYPRVDAAAITAGQLTDYSGYNDTGAIVGTAAVGGELLPNSGASLDCTAGAHVRPSAVNLVGTSWTFLGIFKIPTAQWSGQRNFFAVTGDIDSGSNGKNTKIQTDLSGGASDGEVGAISTRNNLGVAGPDLQIISTTDPLNPDVSFFLVGRYDHASGLSSVWVNGVKVAEGDIDALTETPVAAAIGAYLNEDGTLNGNRLNSFSAHPALALRAVTDSEIVALTTLAQHAPPDVTEPDNSDVFAANSISNEWTAPNAEVEADYSLDLGATWSVMFTRRPVGTTSFSWDVTAIPDTRVILTRYRAWRDASSIVGTAGYSTYVQRTISLVRTAAPVADTTFGLTSVTDNAVRIDVEDEAGLDHIKGELLDYPAAAVTHISKDSTEPTRLWLYGVPPGVEHTARWRKFDAASNPLGPWVSDSFLSRRVKFFIDPSQPTKHLLAHVTDPMGHSASFVGGKGLYCSHSGDTVFTPLDQVAVPQLGLELREWSPTGDPRLRGTLFGARTDEAYGQTFGVGAWSTEMVAFGDPSLNPRNSGVPRWPFATLLHFIPWPEFEGEIMEVHGGDGWWLAITAAGRLRLRFNLNAYGISGSNLFAEAAPPELDLGPVLWGQLNTVYVAVAGPEYALTVFVDGGCTQSTLQAGSVVVIDVVGLLNDVPFTYQIPSTLLEIRANNGCGGTYVAGYMKVDLGDAIYYAKGTSWGAVNVVNVNGRYGQAFRGGLAPSAYWPNKNLTGAQLNSILSTRGTASWRPNVIATAPRIFPHFGEEPDPPTAGGSVTVL